MSQRSDGTFLSAAEDAPEYHLPENHWPLPELEQVEAPAEVSTSAYAAVADTQEYQELRSTFRRFAFPMTIAGLASFFVYVVLSIYAVDFMKQPFAGMQGLTVGFVLGLVQFAVVWIWTAIYVRFMGSKVDPRSERIKARLEEGSVA